MDLCGGPVRGGKILATPCGARQRRDGAQQRAHAAASDRLHAANVADGMANPHRRWHQRISVFCRRARLAFGWLLELSFRHRLQCARRRDNRAAGSSSRRRGDNQGRSPPTRGTSQCGTSCRRSPAFAGAACGDSNGGAGRVAAMLRRTEISQNAFADARSGLPAAAPAATAEHRLSARRPASRRARGRKPPCQWLADRRLANRDRLDTNTAMNSPHTAPA